MNLNLIAEALQRAESELSAYAAHRPLDKREAQEVSDVCRRALKELPSLRERLGKAQEWAGWTRERPTKPGIYLIRSKSVVGDVRVMPGRIYEDDADYPSVPPFYYLDEGGQKRLGTMVDADELGAEWSGPIPEPGPLSPAPGHRRIPMTTSASDDAVERALEALDNVALIHPGWDALKDKAKAAAAGLRADKGERVWICRNYGEYYGEPCGCGHEDELGCGWRLLVGGK